MSFELRETWNQTTKVFKLEGNNGAYCYVDDYWWSFSRSLFRPHVVRLLQQAPRPGCYVIEADPPGEPGKWRLRRKTKANPSNHISKGYRPPGVK